MIVNWRGLPDTICAVRSCLKLNYGNFSIVVVDNGSGDGSYESLIEEFDSEDRVSIHDSGSNLGFAGGNNFGMKHALERGAEFVWLLNNDTEVDPLALSTLIEAAETHPNVGMWGSKIYYYDRRNVLWYAGAEIDGYDGHARHIGFGEVDDGQYDSVQETGYVNGCSLLASANVLQQVGLMSEDYFLYWEEVDWCFRARECGLSVAVQPTSIVWHKVSASFSGDTRLQARYEMRNRLIFHRRHLPNSVAVVLARCARTAIRLRRAGERERSHAEFAGIRDFLLGRTGPIEG